MSETYDLHGDTVPKVEHHTPNVGIENPKVRRIINATLQTAGLIVVAVIAGDAISTDIDVSRFTFPILAVITSLAGGYGLTITQPNIPKL